MCTAAFFIVQMWKQSKCPSPGKWIHKLWSLQTLTYYLSVKSNKVLLHATTRMNLNDITLSERRQTQKTTSCIVPLVRNIQKKENPQGQKVVEWLPGAGGWKSLQTGNDGTCWGDGNVPNWTDVLIAQLSKWAKTLWMVGIVIMGESYDL